MKKKLSLILSLFVLLGSINVGWLSASASEFAHDMTYFMFSDDGVSGDRNPEYAGDHDLNTAWSTVDAQQPGMKFVIDMMKVQEVGKILLYQPAENYPGKYNVYATKYKENWGEPIFTNVDGSATGTTAISLRTEMDMRFIMIELVEGTEVNENPWAINEVEILSIADSSKELQESVVKTSETAGVDQVAFAGKVKMLNDLEIGVTGGEEGITKATFLEWLLKFSNQYQNIVYGRYTTSSFTDVPSSSPYFNMVEYAETVGIIEGGGQFGPTRNITANEALEMAVNTLGYGVYVQESTGYAGGYTAQASRLGISRGINLAAPEMTDKEAVKLFFNMIDVPLLELSINGSGYTITDTQANYAGYIWQGIYVERGLVTASSSTNITGAKPLLDGLVRVEDTLYQVGDTNADSFLGYNVELYAREIEEDDADQILLIYADRSSFMEIPAANLDRVEDNTVYYYEKTSDAKVKRASLIDNFNMVYNGVVMIPTDLSKIDIDNGTVTLIDNDADNEYDFVVVNEYVNYYVSYINQTDKIIYDTYANPALTFGEKNSGLESIQYFKNGESVEFSAMKTGNVVSVVADKTLVDPSGFVTVDADRATVYSVYISDATVTGTVGAINKTEYTMTIDGRKYKMSETYKSQYEAGVANLPALTSNVTAYLDYYGEIAAIETFAADGYVYGYGIKMYFDEEEEKVVIRMYLQSGEMKYLYLDDKVTIDGERYKVDEKFMDLGLLQVPDASSRTGYKFEHQLIMYKCNSAGDITNIDTKLYNPRTEVKNESIQHYATDSYAFNTYRNMLYPREGSSNPNFVTNSMLIFVVPKTESYRDLIDYYRIYDKGYLRHDDHYDMEVYQKTDFNEVTVAVIYRDVGGSSSGGGGGSGADGLVMVNDIDYALDPNDEPKYRLTGTNGRNDVVMYFKDEDVLINAQLMTLDGKINLKRGDVVNLTETNGAEIWGLSRVYDVDNLHIQLSRGGDLYKASRTTTGQVYDANNNYMLITSQYLANDPNAGAFAEVYPIPAGVVYDQEENVVRKATSDDIKAYMKTRSVSDTSIVIINTSWGEVKWCIIYNLEDYVPTIEGQE